MQSLRKSAGSIAFIVLSTLALSCHLSTEQKDELVTGLRFEPEAFDSFTSSASVRYTLARPAVSTLRICSKTKDGGFAPVTILFESLRESKGSHAHTWLGDTEEGFFAPSGSYVGILDVEGERFEAVVRVFHR